jgi:TRAP-type mannitol/chloroaromatic compound transport system substrate-binding protein
MTAQTATAPGSPIATVFTGRIAMSQEKSADPSPVNRRRFLKVASATAVASTAVAAPAIAQALPDITWRQATSWPKSLDTLFGAAEMVGKRVAELTDNKFKIQTFAGGEIVPALQVLDAVQTGTVDCGHTALYYYFGKDDTFVFGSALPFGMNSRQSNAWLMHGGGLNLLNEFLANYKTFGLPAGNTNCQMGGWFRKPIQKVDDLKGLKFRLGGFAGKIMQRVGVVPQQIAGGDIYPALEKGTIDGAEWVGPYDDSKLGFHKVAKFYHYPGWWEPSSTSFFICNSDKYNALPKAYKEALQSACGEVNVWAQSKYDAVNATALKSLVAEGAQLTPFSLEVLDACWKAANELYTEIGQKNAAFKKIYDSYAAFRSDSYLWTQVADYTMDSYMIRVRNAG